MDPKHNILNETFIECYIHTYLGPTKQLYNILHYIKKITTLYIDIKISAQNYFCCSSFYFNVSISAKENASSTSKTGRLNEMILQVGHG